MRDTQENERVCRQCLIREMSEKQDFSNMYEYIENLDLQIKCPDELYEERLQVCKNCERLYSGLCRACGCYVELRAAIRSNACPYKLWT